MNLDDKHAWIPRYETGISPLENFTDHEVQRLVHDYINNNDNPFASLCQDCHNLLASLDKNPNTDLQDLNRSRNDLKATADGCVICYEILVKSDDPSRPRPDDRLLTYYASRTAHRINLMSGKTVATSFLAAISLPVQAALTQGLEERRRGVEPGTSAREIVSTNSYISLWLARKWIRQCVENHDTCKAPSLERRLPTRLVDLGSEAVIRPRLCLGRSLPIETQYATLSHCWGGKVFLQLREENLGLFLQSLPVAELSRTFREAMEICKRLEIRYLWIDSLCIIQNSSSDWSHEASYMSTVYSHTLVNLAATSSPSGTDGMFRTRSPFPHSPLTRRILLPIPSPKDHFAITDTYPDYVFGAPTIEHGPLYARAWVTQEILLARRILHFCDREMYWQCLTCEASETYPEGIPQLGSFVTKLPIRHVDLRAKVVPQEEMNYLHDIWCVAVDTYTKGALTYPEKDKLVAISGVARALGDREFYVAGLWKTHLPGQLLWEVNGGRRDWGSALPSWSWASINGGVTFDVEKGTAEARVMDVKIEWDGMGRVEGGVMVIEGTVFLGRLQEGGQHLSTTSRTLVPWAMSEDSPNADLTVGMEVRLDNPGKDLEDEVCGLIIEHVNYQNGPSKNGVLLVPSTRRGSFRRIGIFKIRQHNSDKEREVLEKFGKICLSSEILLDRDKDLRGQKVESQNEDHMPRYVIRIE